MDQVVEETTFSLSPAAPSQPERRNQSRHLKILRVASLVVDGQRELCLVRNISPGGLMAHVYCSFAEGQAVAAELRPGQAIDGHVAWVDGSNVGIAFNEPIDLEDMLANHANGQKRRLPRVEVDRLAMMRVGARVYGVNTRDISQGGVKLEIDSEVTAGTQVVLEFDRFRPVKGTVRWCHDGLCGVEFHAAIPFQELMGWLRQKGA